MNLTNLIFLLALIIVLHHIYITTKCSIPNVSTPEKKIVLSNINLHMEKPTKKVNFDLSKNEIREIEQVGNGRKITKYEKIDIPEEEEIEGFSEDLTGSSVMIKNNQYTLESNNYTNPQQKLINRLNNKTDDFKESIQNQISYWDNLDIGTFTERTYSNNHIDKINDFRNGNQKGNISDTFNNLTNSKEPEIPLRHDDKSVFYNMDNSIFGLNYGCPKYVKIEI